MGDSARALRLVHRSIKHPGIGVRADDVGRFFVYRRGHLTPKLPPRQTGPRETSWLSQRAARNIKGAARKASGTLSLHAFWTFTFSEDQRHEIASGTLVPGAEIRRFLGWLRKHVRQESATRPDLGAGALAYIWVAENPEDDNPHLHFLTSYTSRYRDFRAFAADVERVWGHGAVHMEWIREARASGHYLLKAVGYTAKGEAQGQGTIRGNRYSISRNIMPKYRSMELLGSESLQDVFSAATLRAHTHGPQMAAQAVVTARGVYLDNGTEEHLLGCLSVLDVVALADGD